MGARSLSHWSTTEVSILVVLTPTMPQAKISSLTLLHLYHLSGIPSIKTSAERTKEEEEEEFPVAFLGSESHAGSFMYLTDMNACSSCMHVC